MRDEVREAALWTVAFALLFFWFVAFVGKNVVTPPSYVTKIKYETVKVCKFRGYP